MAIRDKNCSDNNSYNAFAQVVITVPFADYGAAFTNSVVGGVRMPWPGKILSAAHQASAVPALSGSTLLQVAKNGTVISDQSTATTSITSFTLSVSTFTTGDVLGLVQHNANVTTVRGQGVVSIVVRPYLGVQERVAASLGEL
jgi:hypothetical protein